MEFDAGLQIMEPLGSPPPRSGAPLAADAEGTGPIVPVVLMAIGAAGASLVWALVLWVF